MQTIRRDNIQLLTDDNDFLLHANIKEFSSIQYVTFGVGTRDFALHSVLMFITLPMYVTSSIITCVNIASTTGSLMVSEMIFGFAAAAGIGMYASFNRYFFYRTSNQKTENDLVAKVGFIEDHKSSIALMGAADKIGNALAEELGVINKTIPKLTLSCLAYTFVINAANAIGGQFLGGYYSNQNSNNTAINVMLMSLLVNIQNILLTLTYSYSYVKLNLDELEAFDKAYNQCESVQKNHCKAINVLVGKTIDHLCIKNLNIYKPYPDLVENKELFAIFSKINLDLPTNKIYKIEGISGVGKTTFLKALTGHWQYIEGDILLPVDKKEDICFIPQHSFIPPGTLLEVLTYPLTPQKFLSSKPMEAILSKNLTYLSQGEVEDRPESHGNFNNIQLGDLDYLPLAAEEEGSINEVTIKTTLGQSKAYSILVKEVKKLSSQIELNSLVEGELESQDISWNERLSGGEKQKISIIRALLTSSSLIIMDEATAALDDANKQLVYSMIKEYFTAQDNYMILYTDHHPTSSSFADTILKIQGQTFEVINI